ncbi:MAG: response regulator [Polyangiaceae bacterium]|nr:response regulator [Polyangiaceae bacterium]
MAAESSQRLGDGNFRLGGARADFVASLGRKVGELRKSLARVRLAPDDGPSRSDLWQKLRALGASAKLMKFDVMERAIAEALGMLERTPNDQSVDDADLKSLTQMLDCLPTLVWGDEQDRHENVSRVPNAPAPTYSTLVVGTPLFAEALVEKNKNKPTFACRCAPDAQAAFDLARAMEPDLVVIDADLEDTSELVDALMDDALMETVPIVVVGSFLASGEAARYIAMGVTKTLSKPTSRETLRKACEQALDPPCTTDPPARLGEPTLEQLGEHLALELRNALVGNLDPATKKLPISLGDGTEVLSALWGAIARVREIIAARTNGAVRYAGRAPEGALAFAPSLHHPEVQPLGQPTAPKAPADEHAYADRVRGHARGSATDIALPGRKVLVADDDPAVVWFLADLLRAAGCIVHEALDGASALEIAFRVTPDVVISDILMPKLDGFSLCRALRHDVALRDVPVILLSWKEDLLQRVRELGAGAAGYVRKESDTRAIVARVREALRPRTRIEARLREQGEARGRLDGVSVRTLLEIACESRPNARVSVRDASFLYEVEIRSGVPVRATRTNGEGDVRKGSRVLSALLGVSAGRFTVLTATSDIEGDLEGNLTSQLAMPIARARAATALLTSSGLRVVVASGLDSLAGLESRSVRRIRLDRDPLADYLQATPFGLRDLVLRMAEGTSPSELATLGACDAALAEDLAFDLASRGLVIGVESGSGSDLLSPAIAEFAKYTAQYTDCGEDFRVLAHAQAPSESPIPTTSSSPSLDDVVTREIVAHSAHSEGLAGAEPVHAEVTVVDDTVYAACDEILATNHSCNPEHAPEYAPKQAPEYASAATLQRNSVALNLEIQGDAHTSRSVEPEGRGSRIEAERESRISGSTQVSAAIVQPGDGALPKRRTLPMIAFCTIIALVLLAGLRYSDVGQKYVRPLSVTAEPR